MTPEQRGRYERAVHAIQSATMMEITRLGENGAGADPKHLRVGINSAMAEHGALSQLLIEKGVFTLEEYEEAVVKGVEFEAVRSAELARHRCGLPDSVTFE